MPVQREKAPARSEYQGETYYFCCAACKEKFDQMPRAYASGTEAGAPRG
jgi:YHS domain-containing protein